MPSRDRNDMAQACRELDPREEKNPDGCILIDVRTSREYNMSLIAGAMNIDFFSPSFRAQVE